MCWVLCAPAQTTLLRAVKVRASELHLVPDQGWTPSGGAKDPGTDTPSSPPPRRSPKMGAFGIQVSEQARGASRGPVMTKQLWASHTTRGRGFAEGSSQ